MAILKAKEIEKMTDKERESKLKDLRTELIKAKVTTQKSGKSNPKEIKRTIARILTINKLKEENKNK